MASADASDTVTIDPKKDNGGRPRFCGKHQSFAAKDQKFRNDGTRILESNGSM